MKNMKNIKINNNSITYIVQIKGIVQGVGFRPFIYKLASRLGFPGMVSNTTEGVFIKINVRCREELENFIELIKNEKPPASVIEDIHFHKKDFEDFDSFSIEKSTRTEEKFQLISPDIATCGKCLEDIFNPENKNRYLYPFTNCTNCGPRFTIIEKMPYDRPFTTMKKFDMCPDCLKEYHDPADRRFHAQPNACTNCGPLLTLQDNHHRQLKSKNPIETASGLLKKGAIIAIKSLGGFQIACDATSNRTLKELRKRKNRPVKPFAVMSGDLSWIREHYFLNNTELGLLTSSRAPILLLEKKAGCYPLSYHVSLYNRREGIMLPYTPLHHLLFYYLDVPLVMTSGNISEEPIASDNFEANQRLHGICDYFLVHDRDIYSRYDDSVLRVLGNKTMILRRARGYCPYPVKLKIDIGDKSVLAVGGHEKNTFCILTRNYALVSQHIGDLDHYQSLKFFQDTLKDYKRLFNIQKIDMVVHDRHPDYESTKYAAGLPDDIEKVTVQHHKAHLSAVLAENGIKSRAIGFSWDGTGYGDDGNIWGSEIFFIDSNMEFERVGHMKEKFMPGGTVTIKKPYRMALAYLYHIWSEQTDSTTAFSEFIYDNLPFYKRIIPKMEIEAVEKQIKSGFNSPVTTSAGRFFDAVSSLLDLTHMNSYEGEAAVHLEMSAGNTDIRPSKDIGTFKMSGCNNSERSSRGFYSDSEKGTIYESEISEYAGELIIDDISIFKQIFHDRLNNIPVEIIAKKFHKTLCRIIVDISRKLGSKYGTDIILLSGGVFQNHYLLENCFTSLEKKGLKVFTNTEVPVNDGGISLGQVYLAAMSLMSSKERNLKSCV
jgi:hydrogenase maturation protein HypF